MDLSLQWVRVSAQSKKKSANCVNYAKLQSCNSTDVVAYYMFCTLFFANTAYLLLQRRRRYALTFSSSVGSSCFRAKLLQFSQRACVTNKLL